MFQNLDRLNYKKNEELEKDEGSHILDYPEKAHVKEHTLKQRSMANQYTQGTNKSFRKQQKVKEKVHLFCQKMINGLQRKKFAQLKNYHLSVINDNCYPVRQSSDSGPKNKIMVGRLPLWLNEKLTVIPTNKLFFYWQCFILVLYIYIFVSIPFQFGCRIQLISRALRYIIIFFLVLNSLFKLLILVCLRGNARKIQVNAILQQFAKIFLLDILCIFVFGYFNEENASQIFQLCFLLKIIEIQ